MLTLSLVLFFVHESVIFVSTVFVRDARTLFVDSIVPMPGPDTPGSLVFSVRFSFLFPAMRCVLLLQVSRRSVPLHPPSTHAELPPPSGDADPVSCLPASCALPVIYSNKLFFG